MARSARVTDPLMVSNFALRELPTPTIPAFPGGPVLDTKVFPNTRGRSPSGYQDLLGFQSLSMPEVSVEFRDINEGNWPHAHRIPMTRMSTGDVTLSQAVFANSSDFYTWIFQALYGRGAPRRNFQIVHLGRSSDIALVGSVFFGVPRWGEARYIRLFGCLPVTWRPGSDFDANGAEVSLEELTINVERIDLEFSDFARQIQRPLSP